VFQIARGLVVLQGIARKETQENQEKLKTPITIEIGEEVL
jgi:hypothetical protein